MHGDYCGWHSVNARFYILILKLQTKIIRDKYNYIHDETEKYSKCFLLSSALVPDPAPESHTLHTSTSHLRVFSQHSAGAQRLAA